MHRSFRRPRALRRPFNDARPTEAQWFSLIANIEKLHRREGLELVVIDPLATLLPGYAETCGPKMLDCLMPLQALAKTNSGRVGLTWMEKISESSISPSWR